MEKEGHTTQYDVICIGSSAGGIHALMEVLPNFPPDLPAIVLLVQHLDPRYASRLSDILQKRTQIRVKEAWEGEELQPGTVYIAPPDRHMLVEEGNVRLTSTELVHFVRPSIDLLFESAAASYDGRLVGVILTGSGFDGGMGVQAVKQKGGLVIVQDPQTAESPGMPRNAIATGAVDLILPLEQIGKALIRLVLTGKAANARLDV